MTGLIIFILCVIAVVVIWTNYTKNNQEKYNYTQTQKQPTSKPNTSKSTTASTSKMANHRKPYSGTVLSMNVPPKSSTFNYDYEKTVLREIEEYKDDVETVHFLYIKLQDFYYKNRDLDSKYLDFCIKYCLKDIEMLTKVDEQHINSQIQYYIDYQELYSNEKILKEIKEIKATGFRGEIPAFKRMAIIEEKRNNIPAAMLYCDLAIRWYEAHSIDECVSEFRDRKKKLVAKLEKNNHL